MKVGDIAPNFILKNQDEEDFELYKNLEKHLLLVFYPKDDTPVCSSQLAEYNTNLDDFINNGVNVVALSTDSVKSHLDFCGKLKLNFPLLADEEKKVSRQFDSINFLGMNKRLLVLIGTDRRILWTESTLPIIYIKTGEILEKVKSLSIKEMT
jgi:peroxiredoxin